MTVTLFPTEQQRLILERLHFPEHLATLLRQETLRLQPTEAEIVRDALTNEMARRGFDADYKPNHEGLIIEALIDQLFVP
jgi:hypothetical protein